MSRPVCGAERRRGGKCQSTALYPNGRCRMHGGASVPGGPLHHSWRHGRYSKVVPASLRERYQTFLASPEPLSLVDDVGVVEARIDEALSQLAEGGGFPGSPLAAAERAYLRAYEANQAGDPAKFASAMTELGAELKRGRSLARGWSEVIRLQAHKRRLVGEESRRIAASATVIEASAAWALVQTILDLVKAHVPDPTSRRRIADGLTRLVGAGSGRGVDGGSAA